MGTPGDKTKIREVVRRISAQQEPEQLQEPPSQIGSTSSSSSIVEPLIESSSSTTGEEGAPTIAGMTVLSSLPQYSFTEYTSLSPSLPSQPQSSAISKIENISTPGSDVNLEQARIEHYYTQTKFYTGLESVTQTSPVLQPKLTTKTFLSIEEPGPSGLQTPKTKSVTSYTKLNPKRPKKTTQTSQTATKKSHVCPVCQKSFQNSAKLAKHQLSHNGSSPFKCEHCKKTFSSKFKLVRHLLIHSDRKPFSCSVCERTFHRKDHLKNHIKVHSPSKKHYVCEKPNCKKEYTSLLSFKKHTALHAAEEGSLTCQICSKTFQTKDEILYHLKIHAGSRTVKNPNEKKFTCDHCDRKFFTRKDVRRHLVVHTGMRDFLCQFCPQRFGRKDHLVRHIKKSHSKNFPLESTQTTEIKIEATETSIKSELSESSLSNPSEQYEFPMIEKVEEDKLDISEYLFTPEFLPMPSTSRQSPELKDLGSQVLEEIEETAELHEPSTQLLEEPVLSDTEIMRLLQPTEEQNLPLPGFSQTFQLPPPQPPPQPPPSQ